MLQRTVIAVAIAALALSCTSGGHEPDDFQVAIEQTDALPFDKNSVLTNMQFAIKVTNRTERPWRVHALSLESVKSTEFSVPRTPQSWGQVVAPGESNEFAYWTRVQAAVGFSKMPMPMWITLELASPNGERRTETFTREMNAWVPPVTPQ